MVADVACAGAATLNATVWKFKTQGPISKNPVPEDAGLVFHGDGIVHEAGLSEPPLLRFLVECYLGFVVLGFPAPEPQSL